jgi:hypothetical protein
MTVVSCYAAFRVCSSIRSRNDTAGERFSQGRLTEWVFRLGLKTFTGNALPGQIILPESAAGKAKVCSRIADSPGPVLPGYVDSCWDGNTCACDSSF